MSVQPVVCICLVQLMLVLADKNQLNNFLFSGDFEFIDLTFPFDVNTVYWPNAQDFQFTKQIAEAHQDGTWYASNDFTAGEHGGTHLDAPYHFSRAGKHVGEIALENLIVPLIIVDVSSKVDNNPYFVLNIDDLDFTLNDNSGKPCVIVFKFGWSKYFYDRKIYLGLDERTGNLSFPGLGSDIAEWITRSYQHVVGIGVDVASVDPGASTDFPVHNIVASAGLYSLENVNLSQDVPEYGCTALVMPMKIAEGTGAPLRLVAICPKQNSTRYVIKDSRK